MLTACRPYCRNDDFLSSVNNKNKEQTFPVLRALLPKAWTKISLTLSINPCRLNSISPNTKSHRHTCHTHIIFSIYIYIIFSQKVYNYIGVQFQNVNFNNNFSTVQQQLHAYTTKLCGTSQHSIIAN